jgi:hypothetical protein
MMFSKMNDEAITEACDDALVDENALRILVDNLNMEDDTIDEIIEVVMETYEGVWSSMKDFAMEFCDSVGITNSSDWPHNCIDWEKAGDELAYDYWTEYAADGGIHVFRNV